MGSQPGVMLYFEVRPCLIRLNDGEKGQLFEAILDYGEHGIVPDFDGKWGLLGILLSRGLTGILNGTRRKHRRTLTQPLCENSKNKSFRKSLLSSGPICLTSNDIE